MLCRFIHGCQGHVRYDVLKMPNAAEEDAKKPLEVTDFRRGAQRTQAGCGWFAVLLILVAIAFAARVLLFK